MIFAKPNALVYVHRSGLIAAGKRVDYKRLLFPKDVVANLEVLNSTKFVSMCEQFFTENNFKHKKVLVVLDNDLVFGKKIELDQSGQPDALTDAFIDSMPFNPGQRACLAIQSDKLLHLLATNYDLYDSITEALRLAGVSKVYAITPVAAYDLTGADRKVSSLVERFLKDSKTSRLVNYSSTEPL